MQRLQSSVSSGTESVLDKLYAGALPNYDISEMDIRRLEAVDPPRQFCNGAKLFQTGDKTDHYLFNIAAQSLSSSTWGYMCKHCGLEVGLYPAVRISGSQKALDSSILLTASHLVAFKSMKDRRAFYRCLPCYKERKIVNFPSATSFEKHMEEHPDFTMMNKQDENAKLKDIEMRQKAFVAGIEVATDDPEGFEDIDLEEAKSQHTRRIKDFENSDRYVQPKVGTDEKGNYQQEEANTLLHSSKDSVSESRHIEPDDRDKSLEVPGKGSKKRSAGVGQSGKSQPGQPGNLA
jgi:hypothetical protein